MFLRLCRLTAIEPRFVTYSVVPVDRLYQSPAVCPTCIHHYTVETQHVISDILQNLKLSVSTGNI